MCIILYFVLCKVPSWHCAYFDFKHTYYTNDGPWSYHPKKHKSSSLVQAARHCQQSPSHLVSLQDPNLVQLIRMKLQAQGRRNCVQDVQVFICGSVLVWHIVACKTKGLAAGVAMGKGVPKHPEKVLPRRRRGRTTSLAMSYCAAHWNWLSLGSSSIQNPTAKSGKLFQATGLSLWNDKMTRT